MLADTMTERLLPTISKCGLQILREALGLSKLADASPWSQSFLLSIDFENTDNIRCGFTRGKECQVGLATLDTIDLQTADLSLSKDIVKTYNYVSGSSEYVDKVAKKFLFGESVVVNSATILETIQSIIPQDQNRRIVLISHGAHVELAMLRALGYRFSTNIDVVDTFLVAQEAFGYCHHSLIGLLRRLKCPYNSLHVGGNDARFTLNACLLLALYKYECNENTMALTSYLTEMATGGIAADLQFKAAQNKRKKEKKLARLRKRKAISRSIEEQHRLRVERATKKSSIVTDNLADVCMSLNFFAIE
ncbi:hypothetical protein O1611_g3452 [Lasiodiplodia mahajangana]|uniref:Uncharacterized protein n=1 Tax=Lasiodiplodia mahajangana TaxID=1108764 RepID=A0ACC2JRR7_9PEZI|nr:hypothetical protein O1611_g3452 [Lasiodiplodia mahajangana]